ncbi:MAG: hypothetical protein ACRDDY_00460, partial [Clostridium sp.]|uniref:hypothetical protein n=1 Tax=Clostridium sp. TaxID=1506 RepID=UPI003EE483CE
MEGMKRVTVTIPVEVDLCFTELAKKRNISKDKLMSSILVDWHNTPSSFSKEYVQELKDELENERNKYDSVYEEKVNLEIRLEKMQKHNSRGAGRKELLSDST